MKSFSEIETISKRASRAVGFSWGVSEEVGKNIRLLEMFGLPGVKNLIEYYNKKKEINFENLKLINKENKTNKNPIVSAPTGSIYIILIIIASNNPDSVINDKTPLEKVLKKDISAVMCLISFEVLNFVYSEYG